MKVNSPGKKAFLKMLGTLIVAAVGFSGSAMAAPGTTVNVNFALTDAGDAMNGTPFISGGFQQAPAYYPGTTWNDHVGPTIVNHNTEPGASFTQVNALDSTGAATAIGYTTASTTTQYDLEGPYTFSDHPNTRMLNGGVRRVWNSGSGNALHNRLTISGLDPLKVYNIYLASSQSPNSKGSWRIGAGGTDQLIRNTTATLTSQTWKPGDNWTAFYAVTPDGFGNIDIRGKGDAGGDGGAFSGLTLNGFQVIEATGWLNPDKAIYDFGTPEVAGTSSVISGNGTGDNITWNVLFSSNLAALAPTFTLAQDATCLPASGSTQDFSGGPVNYTVTAQDGTTRTYAVSAVRLPGSAAADILTFTAGAASAGISGTDVTLYVPVGTPVNALVPTITLSPFATVSPASGVAQDFTNPVAYTVTAEDGTTTKNYSVRVVAANYWITDASGNWSEGTNWDPAVVPTSAPETALMFNAVGTYTSTQDLIDGFQLNQLVLGAPALTLAGNSLNFTTSGAVLPTISQNSGSTVTINNSLELGGDTTYGGSGVGQVILGGTISGAGTLTKKGNGTLTLRGTNSHAGTSVLSGTINPWSRQCFGTQLTLAGGVTFNQFNTIGFEGNSSAGAFTCTFVLSGGEVTFDVSFGGSKDMWTSTEISGPGSIKVTGGGRAQGLNLQGVNTFTGGLTIAGPDTPNVSLFNNSSLGTGTLASTMTGGDLTRGGLRILGNLSGLPNAIDLGPTSAHRLVVNTGPDGGASNATFTGPVSGSGGLVKIGNGTLTLAATNSYTGSTRINGGRLLLHGTNSGTGAVTVNADGRLGGNGSKAAAVAVAAAGGLVLDIADWAAVGNGLAVNTLALPAAAITVNVGSVTGVVNFTETAKILPIISATGGITGFDSTLVTISKDANVPGTGSWSIQKTGNTLELVYLPATTADYTAWAAGFSPANVSAPAGDFDGDGRSNFDEYAFGLDPTSGSSVAPITEQLDKATGIFKYTRRATPVTTGLTYTYEWSTTLTGAWNPFTPVTSPPVGDNATPVETITIEVPTAVLTAPALFVRVRAQ